MGNSTEGQYMHTLAKNLWDFPRSITGDGVRSTLAALSRELPDLRIHEVPTGFRAFDWTIPPEWNISEAYIEAPSGERIVDWAECNLHVVGYSRPIDKVISLEELQRHLHSRPDLPEAIPFMTSYYRDTWGFCISHSLRETLQEGIYRVKITSTKNAGSLTYGELILPGLSTDEVFLSTYICHPSMANNELSGPVVAVALARWLQSIPHRHYTYRIAFTPESIGALYYAQSHLKRLKQRVVAGIQLTCIGDDGGYTYLASRQGNTRVDRVAKRVLRQRTSVQHFSFLGRGSDERTYSSPGIDLPFISLMRSRYGDYLEYHTSLDDLDRVVTPSGLQGGFNVVKECITILENEDVLTATVLGEPHLSSRGLYHTMLNRDVSDEVMLRTNILAFADGTHSIQDIAELCGEDVATVRKLTEELRNHGLLRSGLQQSRPEMGPALALADDVERRHPVA